MRRDKEKMATGRLRLGTRKSPLALAQARWTARRLEDAHRGAAWQVELVELTTQGDRDRRAALKDFGGSGVFVKELERALLERRIDFAVHSLKDLPTRLPKGLALAAVGAREDVRDVLILREPPEKPGGLAGLAPGSVIGSGSPRRRAQLGLRFPHLRFAEIRGNVETRLRKVREGRYDGTVLARAGLKRLGLLDGGGIAMHARVLPLSLMLPSPGQGALGLECRAGDRRTRRLLQAVHRPEVAACVSAERACLAALGGGCHLPLGAYAKRNKKKGTLLLKAVLAMPGGSCAARAQAEGPPAQARRIGRRVAAAIRSSPGGRAILKAL